LEIEKKSKIKNLKSKIIYLKELVTMECIVSIIIPTRDRSQLVKRAITSVLKQTLQEIEVIVVIDGLDTETQRELSQFYDRRLRIIQLPSSKGGAAARNAGVAKAKGRWIAFLDDDDEWLPEKLWLQLEKAMCSPYKLPIISCFLTTCTPKGDFIYPRRLPQPSEPLSEYLLARNSISFGEGLIQTSTIFTEKKLLQQIPFQESLAKHQDWDWLLRVSKLPEVGIEFVTQPLAIWYRWEKRQSISSTNTWESSLAWIREHRHLVTHKAYSSFIITQVAPQAAKVGEWQAFIPLLQEAFQLGKPKFLDFFLYLGMWLIPQNTRRSLRICLNKQGKTEKIAFKHITLFIALCASARSAFPCALRRRGV
jgi:glycosyltransferase involved in cell wall biosynthesis